MRERNLMSLDRIFTFQIIKNIKVDNLAVGILLGKENDDVRGTSD